MFWREATIAILVLYLVLLILDALLNKFVQAMVPISFIGWLEVGLVLGWFYLMRSRGASRSTKR